MLFNSLTFLGFFAAVAVVYYVLPARFRWVLLLVASYYFYSTYDPRYLLLLGAATLIAYLAALAIPGRQRTTAGRWILTLAVVAELGILAVFKYFDFFSASLEGVFRNLGMLSEAVALPRLEFLLPAGLSFYVFSAISYVVDTYREKIPPERHLGKLAVYIAFFPKLLAGPIERAGSFLANLSKPIRFNPALVAGGLQLILWGLFKKVVIADRLAEFVNNGFSSPAFKSPVDVLIAVYFYAFQIYCDFSGYSDIAIGCALVLGIPLIENFRRPYFARNVPEFWSGRWHISLMLWFRDYLYIPLGGNRVAKWRWYANQMIVFLTSGLWHGANWTFVIWGGLNGFYQVVYFMIVGDKKSEPVSLRRQVVATAAVLGVIGGIWALALALFAAAPPEGEAGPGFALWLPGLLALGGAALALAFLPLGALALLAAPAALIAVSGFHIPTAAPIVITAFAAVFAIGALRPSRWMPAWLWALLGALTTFHAVLFSWVFFRASSVQQALTVLDRIWSSIPQLPRLIANYPLGGELVLSLLLILFLMVVEAFDEWRNLWKWLASRATALRWGFYYALLVMLVVIGQWGVSEFVYMAF